MSIAFQISDEDILLVMTQRLQRACGPDEAERLLSRLDAAKIEDAALHGDDLETQTGYAHDEIARQLRAMGG